ncbi:MAG: hypothetical protein WBB29_13600 [Geitlerinemataceae cyanobacterium]
MSLPSEPLVCREDNSHQVCILRIKRSAKKYWEYRASVSIDGEKRPIEIYDCRTQVVVRSDGTNILFGEIDPSEIVCSFFDNL